MYIKNKKVTKGVGFGQSKRQRVKFKQAQRIAISCDRFITSLAVNYYSLHIPRLPVYICDLAKIAGFGVLSLSQRTHLHMQLQNGNVSSYYCYILIP